MDFESLNRRELQALCKLNKIPVNMTNIAMVDALKSLETVEGIEEFFNPSRSETAGLPVESPERIGVTSPRVLRTSCRTSTRKKAKIEEAESLPATANKATFHGVMEQWAGEVNEVLKTPLATLCFYLNCICKRLCYVPRFEIYAGSGCIETPLGDNVGEGSVENNVGVSIEKVENDCNEFKKVDVVLDVDLEKRHNGGEKFVMNEVDKLEENSEQVVDNLKPDSEGICNLCEVGYSGEKQMVVDEKIDVNEEALNVSVKEHDAFVVSEEHTDANTTSFDDENPSDFSILKPEGMQNEVLECNGAPNSIHLNTENPSELLKIDNVTEVMTADGIEENISRNTVDFVNPKSMDLEEAQECLMEEMATIYDDDDLNQESHAADVSFHKEQNQFSANGDDDVIDQPPSIKEVLDNNKRKLDEVLIEENEENIKQEEENEKKGLNIKTSSLRQLKKQLKIFQTKYNKDDKCKMYIQQPKTAQGGNPNIARKKPKRIFGPTIGFWPDGAAHNEQPTT